MFQYSQSGSAVCETLGAVTASSTGTVLTASATANTKGAYVVLGTTTVDYERVSITLQNPSVEQSTVSFQIDISVGSTGNEAVIIDSLEYTPSYSTMTGNLSPIRTIELPIAIPKGTQINARVQCVAPSATIQVLHYGFTSGIGGSPGFSRLVCLTGNSSSRGVTLSTSASTNTKAAWTQLTASSPVNAAALLVIHGTGGASTTGRNSLIDLGIGASGSEAVVIANMSSNGPGSGAAADGNYLFVPIGAPSGTRFAARMQSSVASLPQSVGLYALVP